MSDAVLNEWIQIKINSHLVSVTIIRSPLTVKLLPLMDKLGHLFLHLFALQLLLQRDLEARHRGGPLGVFLVGLRKRRGSVKDGEGLQLRTSWSERPAASLLCVVYIREHVGLWGWVRKYQHECVSHTWKSRRACVGVRASITEGGWVFCVFSNKEMSSRSQWVMCVAAWNRGAGLMPWKHKQATQHDRPRTRRKTVGGKTNRISVNNAAWGVFNTNLI